MLIRPLKVSAMLHSSPRFDRCTQDGHEGVHHKEGAHNLVAAAQERDEARAVQAPADDGGERKAAQRHRREDGRPAAVGGGEAGDGQLGTGGRAVVDRDAAAQDDHAPSACR